MATYLESYPTVSYILLAVLAITIFVSYFTDVHWGFKLVGLLIILGILGNDLVLPYVQERKKVITTFTGSPILA